MADKTIGQIVDELADRHFASGMDPYFAGVQACIDVANEQLKLIDQLPKVMQRFYDGLVKKHD